jgi:signal transduction histidine kinase
LYRRFTESSRRLKIYARELEENSEKLEEAKAQLEEYSRTLEQKVEERTKEVKEKQTQLIQSSKMAALGSLVAGVAHEINTPVGAINSMHNTLMRAVEKVRQDIEDCLKETHQEHQKIRSSLVVIDDANKVIQAGTERVIDIVKRLRSFARLDEAELKDADINEGIEDTLTIIHHQIKHEITVVKNYGDIPKIACFPGRLNQVFLNLLINAKQAIEGKGTITISTYSRNNKVYVEIKDTDIRSWIHHQRCGRGDRARSVDLLSDHRGPQGGDPGGERGGEWNHCHRDLAHGSGKKAGLWLIRSRAGYILGLQGATCLLFGIIQKSRSPQKKSIIFL